jgi:hypothetical protein
VRPYLKKKREKGKKPKKAGGLVQIAPDPVFKPQYHHKKEKKYSMYEM